MKAVMMFMFSFLLAAGMAARAETLKFSGYTWDVREAGKGGPGPNNWEPANASVDSHGWLHLKLTTRNGRWYCPEVSTQKRFGFGAYQFWVIGRVDKLDKNVVLGLFNYPPPDAGPDGTNEIDIEFSHWGNASWPIGNYTVWPASGKAAPGSKTFAFGLNGGDYTTQRFTWSSTSVFFQSQNGHYDNSSFQYAAWTFKPKNPAVAIPQKPMPVHLNLWCVDGKAPSDKQPVEIIVREFKFTAK